MTFVADEGIGFLIIPSLREAGHDVLSIAQTQPGASDEKVLDAFSVLSEDNFRIRKV